MEPDILIRPYTHADIPVLYTAVRESIAELSKWMSWCMPSYCMDDSRTWIDSRSEEQSRGNDFPFAIVDKSTGEYLGGCGINQINRLHRFANLGYWVRTSAAKRGIATAAVPLVAQFAFRELKMHRVEIVIAVGNVASQRVAEKSGALYEGVLHNRLLLHGVMEDAWMYSLVPEG